MHSVLRVGTTWQLFPAQQKGYSIIFVHLICFEAIINRVSKIRAVLFSNRSLILNTLNPQFGTSGNSLLFQGVEKLQPLWSSGMQQV